MASSGSDETGQRRIEPTREQLAYIAGYVDGEGCIYYDHSPRIDISNTYPDTLMWIKSIFHGTVGLKSVACGPHRTSYRYRASGENALRICKLLLPFLREKQKQACILIQIVGTPLNSESRKALISELKELKRIDYA